MRSCRARFRWPSATPSSPCRRTTSSSRCPRSRSPMPRGRSLSCRAPRRWPNTLADVAAYYWTRDLRPSLTNDVPASASKGTSDLDPTKDVAWWQHVNFNAISFGADGTLDATNQTATMAAINGRHDELARPHAPVQSDRSEGRGRGRRGRRRPVARHGDVARLVRVRALAHRGGLRPRARSSPASRTSASRAWARPSAARCSIRAQQRHLRGDHRAGMGRRPAEGRDRPPADGSRRQAALVAAPSRHAR